MAKKFDTIRPRGPGANRDPVIAMLRKAKTGANYRYGSGGKVKTGHYAPKAPTLPTLETARKLKEEI
jgi:hypothetical protein